MSSRLSTQPTTTTATTNSATPAQPLHPGIDLNPTTGASILRAHLEACFRRGQLSDVTIRIDRFQREYRLHKVVLSQAQFFASLWTGGWSEEGGGGGGLAEPGMGGGVVSSDGGRRLNLQMDDINISRAAFEVVLARLYSTGPPLFVSPSTHPTPLHPLSPSFSHIASSLSSSTSPPFCPEDAQPATPRFLLSLLATSLFLGLPGVTQGVLGLVIGSMSPWSVGIYLGLATGKGIGGWGGEEWEVGGEEGEVEEKSARGLEELGVRVEETARTEEEEEEEEDDEAIVDEEDDGSAEEGKSGGGRTPKEGVKTDSPSTWDILLVSPISERPSTPSQVSTDPSTPHRPTPSRASLRTTSSSSSLASSRISALRDDDASSTSSQTVELPSFFYGVTSNKVGEACACWLARWGVDVLEVEEKLYLEAKRSAKLASRGRVVVDSFPKSKGKEKTPTSSYFPRVPSVATLPRPPTPHHSFHPHAAFSFFSPSNTAEFPPIFALGGLPATWIRVVISSDAFFVKNEMERYRVAKRVYDMRRAQRDALKGLEAGGVRRGSFETESEEEDGADEEEDEEGEFEELFAKGIYYSHMTFEELAIISHDVNPSTNLPYAPLSILQTSNWAQQELKTRILSAVASEAASTPTSSILSASPSTTDVTSNASADLGISSSTTGIIHDLTSVLEREARRRRRSRSVSASSPYGGSPSSRPFGSVSSLAPYVAAGSPSSPPPLSPSGAFSTLSLLPPVSSTPSVVDTKTYWPVPSDDTNRIGDYGGFLPLQPSGLAMTDGAAAGALGSGKKGSGATERDFFGIGKGWRTGREILEGDVGPDGAGGAKGEEQMWTKYEPFRFSVEFWAVDKLKEKQREYSSTVFYAGSYFNVYAQTIKKKDRQVQLGIYLHRQSMLEPTPTASAPPPTSAPLTTSPPPPLQTPSSPPGSTSVLSTSAPTSNLSHLPHIPISRSLSGTSTPLVYSPPISPPSAVSSFLQPPFPPASGPSASFRDPRKIVRCFFSISCPSALGTSLTRFSSAPDVFSVSQSWGWKSQSLRSEEYLSVLPGLGELKESVEDGVLGWVGEIDPVTYGRLQSLRATVVVGLV